METKLDKACKIFAKRCGVAVLKGDEAESVIRWLGAGALTEEHKKILREIYESIDD